MPGPVSDSYDPEFSTGARAHDVRQAIAEVGQEIGRAIGEELQNIVEVAQSSKNGKKLSLRFTEREWRVIRFCLNRASESI